jgi:S-(hydroxymethyl)mycothiol dehydrogenase
MSQTVRGVVAHSKGAPVEVVPTVIPDAGPGEVVAIAARGVCHTDLHHREGGINDGQEAFETMHRGEVLRSGVVL